MTCGKSIDGLCTVCTTGLRRLGGRREYSVGVEGVDGLDLCAIHARYDKDGPRNQPFHPAMMVEVLVHG